MDIEEPTPKKKSGGPIWKPETTGRKKRGPLEWSLDELIAYRQSGVSPARIPDADLLFKLGSIGVSLANISKLFNIDETKITDNLDWHDNWARGRAECGSRIRAKIVEQALDENVLNAMIYLDKILGGDQVSDRVEVSVTTTELTPVKTEDLLEVMYNINDRKDPV
jgi:hypothetical protein